MNGTTVATAKHRTGQKRGNNEGNIRLRVDGRWEARVSMPDGRRKSLFGKTRAEVQRKLTVTVKDVQEGTPVPIGRITLAQFMSHWLTETVRPRLRPTTYRSYEQMTRNHIVPALGKVLLTDLTPVRIQAFLNAKLAEGRLSARSVQYLHALLRQALGHAYRLNYIARNPLTEKRVPAPRAPRHEVPALSPDDARAVLAAFRGDRLETLVTVALALGVRQGEALGLTWNDVNLEAGTLSVRRQLQRIAGAWQLVEPKSKESRRQIDLPCGAREALRAHRVRQLEERLVAGPRWQGNSFDLVFTTTIGTPLDGVRVTHRFQEKLNRAGLTRLRFHDLRHGAASLLLAQGVHPRVVMAVLGHSQISLTMNTYSHLIPQLTRDAADRMNAVLMNTPAIGSS